MDMSARNELLETTKKTSWVFIRWIFVLLIIYISITTIYGYYVIREDFLQQIASLSVGGFWAFFFGYFGWRLGQAIEDHYINKRMIKKKEEKTDEEIQLDL